MKPINSARLEQRGLIPSSLVQIDKEITSLRNANYGLPAKHVEKKVGHYNLFIITLINNSLYDILVMFMIMLTRSSEMIFIPSRYTG